jgi:hypothetical protein
MLNLKAALLLLLVFASTVTATAVALSISAPAAFRTTSSVAKVGNFRVKPLDGGGDDIDPPTFPH